MVTIEQKLTLFSKLLNQDIKEEMDEKFIQLEREYEQRIAESKFNADQEANEIVEQARKRAEIKKVELMSRGRLASKKEMMQVKEEMVEQFISTLQEKVKIFTQTAAYLTYLENMIKSLNGLSESSNQLMIYLTSQDYESNQKFIAKQLVSNGIDEDKLSFEISKTPILGGLIIVDTVYNTRIDMSMSTVIEEAKESIINRIIRAIGEVGEVVHD
ncbi:MAG: V-type ATP synthase subunit E [Cellulosilyticum sp.]|nr:V-type ATP synthase subunit E [Cellulosilyticum sp.]